MKILSNLTVLLSFAFLFSLSVSAAPCSQFSGAVAVPDNFGASYNVLSAQKELLVKTDCSATSVSAEVGNSQSTQYIYKYGYIWRNGKWEQITFSPSGQAYDVWLVGKAMFSQPLSAEELAKDNYILAYICAWTGSTWKCGCRDALCSKNFWQLQKFKYVPGTACAENWICGEWGICQNNKQARTCTDQNKCGTTGTRPEISRSCAAVCTESWICGDWSACQNNKQTRNCVDQNKCGTITAKPNVEDVCTVKTNCLDTDIDGYDNCAPGSAGDDGKAKDCNDNERYSYPGGQETCDTVDNNCNGQTDEGCDDDKDGYCDKTIKIYRNNSMCPRTVFAEGAGGNDCDDAKNTINPGASEICGNQIDEDCSGADMACGGSANPSLKDVVYKNDLKLDVYKSSAANSPVLLLVHGGGWHTGDKKEPWYVSMAEYLAEQGINVVAINYSLASQASLGYPAALKDIDCSLRWISANSAVYGFDSNKFYIGGPSAGGHLALLYALNQGSYVDSGCSWPNARPVIKKTVGLSSPTDLNYNYSNPDMNVWKKWFAGDASSALSSASPSTYLGARKDIEFFVMHAKNDETVDYGQALAFFNNMKNSGYSVEGVFPDTGGHMVFYQTDSYAKIKEFLNKSVADAAVCTNECSAGQKGCVDSSKSWSCGEAGDGDVCLEKILNSCNSDKGEICDAGTGACAVAPSSFYSSISYPVDNQEFAVGQNIYFSAYTQNGAKPYTYEWKSSLDGIFGRADYFSANTLRPGKHAITITVRDAAGNSFLQIVNINIRNGLVLNFNLEMNEHFYGKEIYFNAQFSGGASPYKFTWKSDKDGVLFEGEGEYPGFISRSLSIGSHIIELNVVDKNGNAASKTANILIKKLECIDNDNDGYGANAELSIKADPVPGKNIDLGCSKYGLDCNDSNAAMNPGIMENCDNGIDDNCDGQIDECKIGYEIISPSDKDSHKWGSEMTFKVSFNANVESAFAEIFNADNSLLRLILLNDAGKSGDQTANDETFGGTMLNLFSEDNFKIRFKAKLSGKPGVFYLNQERNISISDKPSCTPVEISGTPEDKMDLVIVADQYPSFDGFSNLVNSAKNYLFAIKPFDVQKSKINIHRVNSPVNFRCAGYGSSAVDANKYCSYSYIYNAASVCPLDTPVVFVNTSGRSWASKRSFAVVFGGSASVMVHEFGHSFAGLDDEYVESAASIATSTVAASINCDTDAACSKWAGVEGAGCFNGCDYRTGFYRSVNNGIMRTSGTTDFGAVNTRHINSLFEQYK